MGSSSREETVDVFTALGFREDDAGDSGERRKRDVVVKPLGVCAVDADENRVLR